MEALKYENVRLASELGESRAALGNARAMVEDGDARGAQLGMQLLAAQGKEEELLQEIRSMQALLERTQALASHRQQQQQLQGGDKLMNKYDALKKTAAILAVASDTV
jgi:hypothetical protein